LARVVKKNNQKGYEKGLIGKKQGEAARKRRMLDKSVLEISRLA